MYWRKIKIFSDWHIRGKTSRAVSGCLLVIILLNYAFASSDHPFLLTSELWTRLSSLRQQGWMQRNKTGYDDHSSLLLSHIPCLSTSSEKEVPSSFSSSSYSLPDQSINQRSGGATAGDGPRARGRERERVAVAWLLNFRRMRRRCGWRATSRRLRLLWPCDPFRYSTISYS